MKAGLKNEARDKHDPCVGNMIGSVKSAEQ